MSEVETSHDRLSYVLDVITSWADEHNAAFLAKENTIVWWYSITGDEEDYEWKKCTPIELVRLIKVTRLSHEYMGTITTDTVISAFQESGRAYLEAVRTPKKVRGEYFNYLDHEVTQDIGFDITLKVVHWFQINRINPEWMMVQRFLFEIIQDAGVDQPSPVMLNKWMKQAARELRLTSYHGNTRYKQGDRRYPCIYNKMLRPRQPITIEWDESWDEKIMEKINA